MNEFAGAEISRRGFLAGSGALIVSFSLLPARLLAQAQAAGPGSEAQKVPVPPGSLKDEPMLDAWIRIDADGKVTVFTGKAELGQGIKTALMQVAAEELEVDFARVNLVTADTGRTPNEGYTAGSHSMQDSGTAIMNAAAQVREILVGLAARRFNIPPGRITARNGELFTDDGRRLTYGDLVSGDVLHVRAQAASKLKSAGTHRLMGRSIQRVDIPAKVAGGASYVQDLRLPGMVHARVVRPPSNGARLAALDAAGVERMPGVLKIVRDGSFVAVVAEREYQAVTAMRALAQAASWRGQQALPIQADIYSHLQALPSQDSVIFERTGASSPLAKSVESSYRRPYQMHGAIGPSCAVGLFREGVMTIWTHAQGVYPLRSAIAEMLRLRNDRVHCIHMEGSGCYGHNGADDAAGDAALIAHAFPGRPVRVQWMRDDEHCCEPYGPAMVTRARAALDGSGDIADWQYEVWSNTHSSRPGPAGNLASAMLLDTPFSPPPPRPLPQPEGGGDRNAIPLYRFANARVTHHFIPAMPLRVSALRGLGAYMNIFSIESFMDELAKTANRDTVEFRLRHIDDPRARDVIVAAAERFGWATYRTRKGRGRGFAFARYKNLGAYAAMAFDVEVEHESGRVRVLRAVAAVDSGHAVNPDGIRNQIEGGIIQSLSWTMYESVTFEGDRITSRDWSSYPILRFSSIPDSIEVHVIDRPGQPFLGTGEAAQGPTAACFANALADATGVRIRELPLSPRRVKAAIGV